MGCYKCLTCPQYGRTGDDCKKVSYSELQCFVCCNVETKVDKSYNYKCKFTGKLMKMETTGRRPIMPQRQYIPLATINSGNASLIRKAEAQADSKTAVQDRRAAKRRQKLAEKAAAEKLEPVAFEATVLLPPSEKIKDARGNLLKHIKTTNDNLSLIQEFDAIVDGLVLGEQGVYIGDATLDKDGNPVNNEYYAWLCKEDRQNVLLDAITGDTINKVDVFGDVITCEVVLKWVVGNGAQSRRGEELLIEHAMKKLPFGVLMNQSNKGYATDVEGRKDHAVFVVVVKDLEDAIVKKRVGFNSELQKPKLMELEETFKKFSKLNHFVTPCERKRVVVNTKRLKDKTRRDARRARELAAEELDLKPATEELDQKPAAADLKPATEELDQKPAAADLKPAAEELDQKPAAADLKPAAEELDQKPAAADLKPAAVSRVISSESVASEAELPPLDESIDKRKNDYKRLKTAHKMGLKPINSFFHRK
jgi:hypothetical protein